MFNFAANNLYSSGIIYASGDTLNFLNTLNQYKINLWGTNNSGFGIASDTLQYSSQNYHKFYNSSNNANTFTIDGSGNVSSSGHIFAGGPPATGGFFQFLFIINCFWCWLYKYNEYEYEWNIMNKNTSVTGSITPSNISI